MHRQGRTYTSMRHPRLQLKMIIGNQSTGFAYLDRPNRVVFGNIIS